MARALITNPGEALEKQLTPIVNLPKVAAPFTTITGRSLVTDFSNDLMPRMGIERIMTQQVQEVFGETGSNGEKVYKPLNDIHDQIRFVGSWGNGNNNGGQQAQASQLTDFVEVTFYGTGLNGLYYYDSGSRTVGVSVDGGGVTSVTVSGSNTVLTGRNTSINAVYNLVSGLTLGLHTVKLTHTGANFHLVYGFEILNEASTLKTAAGSCYYGGRKPALSAVDSQAYNSGFQSGTLGTKGGRVITYIQDNLIKKVLQPTDTTQLNYPSASHTNEELIRSYHPREFGASRADDFSLGEASTDRGFTLDDNTTTLMGNDVEMRSEAGSAASPFATAAFIAFTFVGTGLDVVLQLGNGNDTYNVEVDGVSIFSGTFSSGGNIQVLTRKIVSGLPYGTHIVKFTNTNGAISDMYFRRFDVYGPKKPTVPADAVELADYYIMADFSAAGGNAAVNNICPGVLRKVCTRELVYRGAGTWTAGLDVINSSPGWTISNGTVNAIFEYTFVGTGIVLNMHGTGGGTGIITVKFNNVLNATGFNITGVNNDGGGTYTVNVGSSVYKRVSFSGLPFGKYTVTVERTGGSGSNLALTDVDVITPIHSPKPNMPGSTQNTAVIGSCAVGDKRKFSEIMDKELPSWAQATGISSNPTTTSTAYTPIPDMEVALKTSGNPIDIHFNGVFRHSASTVSVYANVYVDGIPQGIEMVFSSPSANFLEMLSENLIIPVAPGIHTVQVFFKTDSGTATADGVRRILTAKELK